MKSRLQWTAQVESIFTQEDQCLKYLRVDQGLSSWDQIATKLFQKIKIKPRSGKQCRQRFVNFSNFRGENAQDTQWDPASVQILFQTYLQIGPKWMHISKILKNRYGMKGYRSANSIKNKFYGTLRRLARNINIAMKAKNLRINKPLNQKSLMAILNYQIDEVKKQIQSEIIFQKQLKKILLNCLLNNISDDHESQNIYAELGLKVKKFNDKKRFQGINKKRENKSRERTTSDWECLKFQENQEEEIFNNLDRQQENIKEEGVRNVSPEKQKVKYSKKQGNKNFIPQMKLYDEEKLFNGFNGKFQDLDEQIQEIFNQSYAEKAVIFSD